ncbi:magnesium/cobalt transporter CorA [Effusibacillus lacus]|uniref:Magnesium transport protein CorA n=1 Tax=Effusibacillus lacus TaxID=1348429 RepID=A0A292YRM7_9BACL|nr:magnesium/cobalt transporter CorA [Effusibacillus lacus]TCS74895.1 magnesium transporter [Effusibacillus lacus]GAX91569.1 magnesium transporter [Effusibacillus lacus]
MIKTYFYNHEDKKMYHDVDLLRKGELLQHENNLLWIDLYNCTVDELKFVGAIFDFHPLAIEDCLHDSPRSKVDNYDDYYFFVFHALRYDEESEREITTEELNVFLGKNYIVTVHQNPLHSIGRIAARSLREPHYMNKGPDFLLYSIVDGITDEYFPIMERISTRIDELEDEMYEHPAQEITEEFLALKRTIVLIRRVIQPKKRIFANVGGRYSFDVQEDNVPYFIDLVDHLERISDSLEVFRDLVSGAMETYYSLVTARTNDTIRVLTIISTVAMPLTFITGFFGMNVPLPFSDHWISTVLITLLLGVMTFGMLKVFREKKWI